MRGNNASFKITDHIFIVGEIVAIVTDDDSRPIPAEGKTLGERIVYNLDCLL